MKRKSKTIVLSLLTIALLLTLTVGATFALFTDQADINVAITSAKVDIEVELETLELYSMDERQQNTFANGGTAEVNNEGVLELINITPGDKVVAHYSVINHSNVMIKYNVLFNMTGELAEALVTSVDGTTAGWTTLGAGEEVEDVVVTIELPAEVGNEFQEKSANVLIQIQAIQANGHGTVNTAEALQERLSAASTNPRVPVILELGATVELDTPLLVKEGTDVEINLNGHDILASASFDNGETNALIYVPEGSSLVLKDTSGLVRYGAWVDGAYVISETETAGADKLVGGNISMGTAEGEGWTVSTIISRGHLTLDGVTMAGIHINQGNGVAIFSGVGATSSPINEAATLTIKNSTICGNWCQEGSGIVYTNNKTTVSDSVLSHNKSYNGGAVIGRYGAAKLEFERCVFNGNYAGQGSAVQIRAGADLVAKDCTITNNVAEALSSPVAGSTSGHGAALYIMGSPSHVVVENCIITGNSSNGKVTYSAEDIRTNLNFYAQTPVPTTPHEIKISTSCLYQGQLQKELYDDGRIIWYVAQ